MALDTFDLSGRTVLITGGNGGIGLGMAEGLAKSGADLCIWGTNADKNAAAVEQLAAHGTKVQSFICNVADADEVDAVFAQTLASFGSIFGCIANAGIGSNPKPFTEVSREDWRRVMSVNLDGVFYTYQAVAKHMVERSKQGNTGGRLVATSSLGSQAGMARSQAYAASKGALNSMTYALAVEYGRWGITANAILPGFVESDMTAEMFKDPQFAGAMLPHTPIRRWGQPVDFAGIAVYLMSDASAWHTGQLIQIDGGFFRM